MCGSLLNLSVSGLSQFAVYYEQMNELVVLYIRQPELLSDCLASEERLCSQEAGNVPCNILVCLTSVEYRYSSDGATVASHLT
jgi:hypothetical protein